MKRAIRIIIGVIVGVLILGSALLVADYPAVIYTAKAYAKKYIPEKRTEWNLNGVKVWKQGKVPDVTYYLWGQPGYGLSFAFDEDENRTAGFDSIYWNALSDYSYKAEIADKSLGSNLPGHMGDDLRFAKDIVGQAKKYWPWPIALRDLKKPMNDVMAGRLVVMGPMDSRQTIRINEVAWGNTRYYVLTKYSGLSPKVIVSDNEVIVHIEDCTVKFTDVGNTVFTSKQGEPAEWIRTILHELELLTETVRSEPNAYPKLLPLLEKAARRLADGKYSERPMPAADVSPPVLAPWKTEAVTRVQQFQDITKEDEKNWGTAINGITVVLTNPYIGRGEYTLRRDELLIRLETQKNRGIAEATLTHFGKLTIGYSTSKAYPLLQTKLDARNQAILEQMRKTARDLLAAESKWPPTALKDALENGLKAIVEGRFYVEAARSRLTAGSIYVAEGNDIQQVFTLSYVPYQDSNVFMDLILRENGFIAYDGLSGSSLEVTNAGAKLRQVGRMNADGEFFDYGAMLTIGEMINRAAPDIPAELAPGRKALADFMLSSKRPQPELVDAIEVPRWASGYYREVFRTSEVNS
jgi:hypothetical protein